MEDLELLQRIEQHDEEALEILMDRYSKLLWVVSLSILGKNHDPQDIEEIVSDAFLRIWKAPTKYQPKRGSFKNYLILITRSLSINKLRRSQKDYQLNDPFTLENIPMAEENREFIHEMFDVINSLNDPMREICLQRYIFENTPAMISSDLSIPQKTVNNYLYRGKRMLQQAFAEQDTEFLFLLNKGADRNGKKI
ncbi:RNA polymerase sigma factor [Candidatus Enterococcus murrayae]|uniref:Sigma-70 family RNA polymerase sigma factor n=1 Tax=Candidatus Enterococcus murrayae TaxID=2815321 RepID=A0ABS3HJU5_9ENTE|nr:sigma-70 family RNA polymerase sigma factor [Enterococcus sp. MJM16]MBO0453733.1 sigma-70 family RNA polymerase sigma factor [Enterococcus sp. MJM16]